MTDQTTHLSPHFEIIPDEDGFPEIIHNGCATVHVLSPGLDLFEDTKAVYDLLCALTYSRRDYSDGSVGYWANFQDGTEFYLSGDTIQDVIQKAARELAMYVAGRNGYEPFDALLETTAKENNHV